MCHMRACVCTVAQAVLPGSAGESPCAPYNPPTLQTEDGDDVSWTDFLQPFRDTAPESMQPVVPGYGSKEAETGAAEAMEVRGPRDSRVPGSPSQPHPQGTRVASRRSSRCGPSTSTTRSCWTTCTPLPGWTPRPPARTTWWSSAPALAVWSLRPGAPVSAPVLLSSSSTCTVVTASTLAACRPRRCWPVPTLPTRCEAARFLTGVGAMLRGHWLTATAAVLPQARNSSKYGISCGEVKVDFGKVMERMYAAARVKVLQVVAAQSSPRPSHCVTGSHPQA